MSYILDALRKSEREHSESLKREAGSSPLSATSAAVPAWVWLALGMAASIAIVTAFGLWWFAPPESPSTERLAPATPPAAVRDLTEQAHVPAPHVAPAPPALPAASPPVSAEVPFLRSLPDELRRSLPEMTVNIHVYTPEASRRLLYINNREYHKGEYIGGVLIEDVLPDGALMNYQGIRFKLERPR
jgi:hypothetical protein